MSWLLMGKSESCKESLRGFLQTTARYLIVELVYMTTSVGELINANYENVFMIKS